ncbi:gliding motility-associated C-terminal domain-containing protein [Hymenobacter sp. 5317J-9]|uniref:T9SS type B sorting domain-containing protein n=1 Tax=Hymenobacter sp. 5317J-9 TaxID=2932250 RepID=UPI001FD691BD|nr:gliding motility-associated C-terminal domain-containing protein [Hymenobacter sp. 5317J-9]UOQ99749.1 gliding motility-associated C-terminal domain-containing protein [Hymenobacter sp. 5317J-9]
MSKTLLYMPVKPFLLLLILELVSGCTRVWAQPETRNWRFARGGGLTFPAVGPPVATPSSALVFHEACSTISSADGRLLCSASGTQVWDSTNAPMPNGMLSRGHESATQGALLVPSPRNPQEVYLFTVDALENELNNGLRYSIIDLRLRGGLGDIGPVKEVAVPLPGGRLKVTEKLTAVPLPNGRDYWIIVHDWGTNLFYCFLLNPAGLQAAPVVSAVGAVHQNPNAGTTLFQFDNAGGYLRAAPNGRQLALVQSRAGLELFDFNNQTGQVSNARSIPTAAVSYYGLEFSPDSSKLYLTALQFQANVSDLGVYQLDLANQNTLTRVGTAIGGLGAVLRGNDSRLYVRQVFTGYLGVIEVPNAAGLACDFRPSGQPINLRANDFARVGLPNFAGGLASIRVVLNAAASQCCVGSAVTFSAEVLPFSPGTSFTWNFGDASAGPANMATGFGVSHVYALAGTFTATVTAVLPGGGTYTAQHPVTVVASPVLNLGPRLRTLCAGQALTIGPVEQPAGTTYRWRDGLATAARSVRAAGRYVLTLTSPEGCTVQDSVDVQLLPKPLISLGRDTVLCFGQPAVQLYAGPQPAGSNYRWQDGSVGATFAATQPGLYHVEVRNAAGCVSTDSLLVSDEACPFTIPNIITPNGDRYNATLVLQGLLPSAFSLRVFNRWGREVFSQAAYDNAWAAQGLPDGVYYYLLTKTASGRKIKGWVEVKR